jgi:hypothetical protein
MDTAEQTYWKLCSSCKKEISFGVAYQTCSVSTCHSGKTALFFCSVACWDAHLGFARHRESAALEERAPTREAWLQAQTQATPAEGPRRVIVRPKIDDDDYRTVTPVELMEVDTLVVVSKVKKLIRDQAEMNTSQCAIETLTQIIVKECLKAIEQAKDSGRKTVMGRDF